MNNKIEIKNIYNSDNWHHAKLNDGSYAELPNIKEKNIDNYKEIMENEFNAFRSSINPRINNISSEKIRNDKEKHKIKLDELRNVILDYEKKQIESMEKLFNDIEKYRNKFNEIDKKLATEYLELQKKLKNHYSYLEEELRNQYENKYNDELKEFNGLSKNNKEIVKLYNVLLNSFDDEYSEEEKLQILKSIGFIVASYAGNGLNKGDIVEHE